MRVLPILLVTIGLAIACATNPVTGRREINFMSEAQEISIANESDPQIKREMGVYNDPELQNYVTEIGMRMAKASERPQLPWRFTVVDVPAVNAFAIPGGSIYITRGIMPFLNDEAQLAGVIGHEIGHVTARHSAQQYTKQISGQIGLVALNIFVPASRPFGDLSTTGLGVLFLKFGRDDELQADQLGAKYESMQGWDPAGVPAMLNTLGRLDEAAGEKKGVPNWLSTHPEPLTRVNLIQPTVDQLKAGKSDFSTNPDALLKRLDGIVYGDSPEQGLARGSTFLHPVLRLRVDFPQGWEINNSPEQVVAKAPGADVYMLLEQVQMPQGRTIRDIALNSMGKAGFRTIEGQNTTINGLDAFVGVYQGQLEGLGAVTIRAAHIADGKDTYVLAGFVSPNTFRQSDNAFLTSIRSFRKMTAAEAENIHPDRVDFYVVRAGDTWQSIAERSGGAVKAATLAIMNSAQPNSQPQVGARIKTVVRG
jgi:predicted Zn-dependent protease